jgi:hypothetical protein
MSSVIFPAHGWLPPGSHFELKWDDQGRDFATGWQNHVQAPGSGEVIAVHADGPFPNGFGPRYPVVHIDSGAWAGHQYYLGHTTSLVTVGEHFSFGHPLAVVDQGRDWAGTVGGWMELGEAFKGLPGPKATHHWFDALVATPLVVAIAQPTLVFGDQGLRVLGFSSQLRDCGYLPRPYWHFNRPVHGALVRFKKRHNLPANHGILDDRTAVVLTHASQVCKRSKRKEV